jgi:hypothetical protein
MSRQRLFPDEPVAELRGLSSLTDPDAAGGVIDVAVFGARGDGKTQFIVHAIRTLRAHAPTLGDAERGLNREVLRVVMDPRAPRPEATPPGFVPHYTFRVRPSSLVARLRWLGTLRLLWREQAAAVALGALALVAAILALAQLASTPTRAVAGLGMGLFATAAMSIWYASRQLRQADELEVAFWDIAGEHVYSASAADYYSLLAALIEKRKQRAAALGRPYAFAPVLLCNPIALGTRSAGSPFERLRQLLPLFAAIDDQGGRALIAVNRWSVVDPICERGALRDEIVAVTALALGEETAAPKLVARDVVRRHCLDTEDGRDGDVVISHLRYDTAIRCSVEEGPTPQQLAAGGRAKGEATAAAGDGANADAPADAGDKAGDGDGDRDEVATAGLIYRYDEGPGAFGGESASRFLDWLMRGLRHPVPARAARPSRADKLLEKAARDAAAAPAGAVGSHGAAGDRAEGFARQSDAERREGSATESRGSMETQRGPFADASVRRAGPRTNGRLEALELPRSERDKSEKRPDSRADLPSLEQVPAVSTAVEVWARPTDPGGAR